MTHITLANCDAVGKGYQLRHFSMKIGLLLGLVLGGNKKISEVLTVHATLTEFRVSVLGRQLIESLLIGRPSEKPFQRRSHFLWPETVSVSALAQM